MHLDHINIKGPAELLENEKQFFCDVLGLREGYRPEFPSKGFWLYADDKAVIHLSESNQHVPTCQQGCFDHVAFRSSDLAALVQRLERKHIEHSLVHVKEISLSQVFLKSPSGTRIEINGKMKQ